MKSPRYTVLKKTNPFLLPTLAVPETVVPLRCSGFGQILELLNEHFIPKMPFGPFKYLSNIVHDNGIVAFGIPINGVPNDTRILHCIIQLSQLKNVSVFNDLLFIGIII
jgi:hypothetical protein